MWGCKMMIFYFHDSSERNSSIRKIFPSLNIFVCLFLCRLMDSYSMGYNLLLVIICFTAQFSKTVQLEPLEAFSCIPLTWPRPSLSAYFMVLQDISGLLGTFPTPSLVPAVSVRNCDSFYWRMVFRK